MGMKVKKEIIRRNTRGNNEVQHQADDPCNLVRANGVLASTLSALGAGSTASLSTIEFEPERVHHDLISGDMIPGSPQHVILVAWDTQREQVHDREMIMVGMSESSV
jgi:hypothetical protein